jgi:lysophospholipase L1-like esterase
MCLLAGVLIHTLPGRDLLFWSLFAPLIPQALRVRKTALRFRPAAGQSTGEVGQAGTTIRLLAIGDSIIAGVGARTLQHALVGQTAEYLAQAARARVAWTACGRIGATSRQIEQDLLPQVEDDSFDAILVSTGVNDVISLHGLERWRNDVEALLDALSVRWPEAVISFSGLPPMQHFPALPQPLRAVFGLRARQFDQELRRLLEHYPQASHVPLDFEALPGSFSGDGFHPSERSYAEFGAMAGKSIRSKIFD